MHNDIISQEQSRSMLLAFQPRLDLTASVVTHVAACSVCLVPAVKSAAAKITVNRALGSAGTEMQCLCLHVRKRVLA